jgi:hypothetical protein
MSEVVTLSQTHFTMAPELNDYDNNGPVELLPNPEFVFPARPEAEPMSNTWSRRSEFRQTTDRPRHTSLLPNFTFNPAASLPVSPTTPPPLSPIENASTPSRGTRHRRGGSEFIGKDNSTGIVNIVNASPIKGESTQPMLRLGPPPGRRHAHRRSGAISCHDLSSILNRDANNQSKSESAPTSPLEPAGQLPFSLSEQMDSLTPNSESQEQSGLDRSPQKRPSSRARVGFSEKIEYIRPLSIISSETASSISTIRGHSVSGSFSSMLSSEMSPQRMVRPMLYPVEDEAVVEQQEPISIESSEPKSKKRGFPWFDSRGRSNPAASPQELPSETIFSTSPPDSPLQMRRSLENDSEASRDLTQAHRKPRKVRSWAHSLISRKNKSKKSRSPSPPPSGDDESETDDSASTAVQSDADPAEFEINFDDDNTVTIVNESVRPQPPSPLLISTLPRAVSEIRSPVIDLDAALGPFNTPPMSSNTRDFSRQPPRARRSMHSLNGVGPTHRRTESAPELVPFDARPAFTMPDVFEEEGEEESDETTPTANDKTQIIEVVPAFSLEQLPSTPGFGPSRRKKSEGLVISTNSSPRRMSKESRASRERSSIEVVEAHEEPREYTVLQSISPLQNQKEFSMSESLQLGLPLAAHYIMTPDTMSDISDSPFFSPSQASLTTPRLGTASTSPDDNIHFNFGEPGPEVRLSVEDVPSLTSSTSTMASPLASNVMFAVPPPPSSNGRAASIFSIQSSGTAEMCTKRRSSMANLGRFVAGGFGMERSKLSLEQRPMSQQITLDDAKMSKQRRHRLSKLMLFWKGKEATPLDSR